ncbi:VOC family protein [Pseudoduganella buxea]|uniref:VOC family protein n=1 Tax=Pseudoduganella buxea TaxID=1949069 RepID=A0A6I3SZW7_9BURK|nr:VOC family protein [Pseudoduganella buxea]MTV54126.1 VOC family protein [Pseudoduganella buxea]GGC14200.1 VOC family protein [Pseudoduganella buxea]
MTIQTVTHLNFDGQAGAALHFYHAVFGGGVTAATYRDAGQADTDADAARIIWGQVRADNGFHIMAHDVPTGTTWHPGDKPFYVSVRGDSPAQLQDFWHNLAAGGEILHPLAPAPWTPLYGMLKDRFGVTWVLDVARTA